MEETVEQPQDGRKRCTCGTCKNCKSRPRQAVFREENREKRRATQRVYFLANRAACAEANRKWQKDNPEKVREIKRRRYGLKPGEYARMLTAQEGVCACCGKPESMVSKDGELKALSIDHCHRKGDVRGLLRNSCNIKVGHIEKDLEQLRAVLEYLKKHDSPAIGVMREVLGPRFSINPFV